MKELIVLDYSNMTVHFFNVDSSIKIDEEYVYNLGFHTSNCSWMFGEDIEIIRHKGLLK